MVQTKIVDGPLGRGQINEAKALIEPENRFTFGRLVSDVIFVLIGIPVIFTISLYISLVLAIWGVMQLIHVVMSWSFTLDSDYQLAALFRTVFNTITSPVTNNAAAAPPIDLLSGAVIIFFTWLTSFLAASMAEGCISGVKPYIPRWFSYGVMFLLVLGFSAIIVTGLEDLRVFEITFLLTLFAGVLSAARQPTDNEPQLSTRASSAPSEGTPVAVAQPE